jgi:PAT family beta-lactamase induction signal transducer AmpG
LMVGAAVFSALLLPRLPLPKAPATPLRRDLAGFLAVAAAVLVGYLATDRLIGPAARALFAELLSSRPGAKGWVDLCVLLAGIGLTLPLAAWAARRARFETLLSGLGQYFAQPGAVAMLVFIVLYKLGDAFAGSLMTPFLLQGVGFAPAEVGLVNKVMGLWLTILGALAGGALMWRIGLWRALMAFGVLQLLSNLGFWWLAVHGQGAMPGLSVPPFDLGFVKLSQATPVDGGLLMVIAFENLSGGMGTAAFVAFLMSLTSQRFSATQYALLSAFASIGRVWVGPLAGVLVEAIGWPAFFVVSTVLAAPALLMLVSLRTSVQALELEPRPGSAVDD